MKMSNSMLNALFITLWSFIILPVICMYLLCVKLENYMASICVCIIQVLVIFKSHNYRRIPIK